MFVKLVESHVKKGTYLWVMENKLYRALLRYVKETGCINNINLADVVYQCIPWVPCNDDIQNNFIIVRNPTKVPIVSGQYRYITNVEIINPANPILIATISDMLLPEKDMCDDLQMLTGMSSAYDTRTRSYLEYSNYKITSLGGLICAANLRMFDALNARYEYATIGVSYLVASLYLFGISDKPLFILLRDEKMELLTTNKYAVFSFDKNITKHADAAGIYRTQYIKKANESCEHPFVTNIEIGTTLNACFDEFVVELYYVDTDVDFPIISTLLIPFKYVTADIMAETLTVVNIVYNYNKDSVVENNELKFGDYVGDINVSAKSIITDKYKEHNVDRKTHAFICFSKSLSVEDINDPVSKLLL